MKRLLILVTGLDHSGTTILDMALGVSPQITGLGEALYMLGAGEKVTATRAFSGGDLASVECTCRQSAANCAFWSQGSALFRDYSIGKTFPALHDIAMARFPETRFVLDSSPSSWRYLDQLDEFDLRVIRLTRDVRSWSASYRKRRKAGTIRSYRRWMSRNKEITRVLNEKALDVFRVGYEELALRPEDTLQRICDWLGVAFLPQMLQPGAHSGSHIVEGNVAGKSSVLSASIRYDGSWMAAPGHPFIEGLLMSLCKRQNNALVYRNKVIRRKA